MVSHREGMTALPLEAVGSRGQQCNGRNGDAAEGGGKGEEQGKLFERLERGMLRMALGEERAALQQPTQALSDEDMEFEMRSPAPGLMAEVIVVKIKEPGPLAVKLRHDAKQGFVVINNFDPVPDPLHHSGIGPVERCGKVMVNDVFLGINNYSLFGAPWSACIASIRQVNKDFAEGLLPCKVLYFRRPAPANAATAAAIEQDKLDLLRELLFMGPREEGTLVPENEPLSLGEGREGGEMPAGRAGEGGAGGEELDGSGGGAPTERPNGRAGGGSRKRNRFGSQRIDHVKVRAFVKKWGVPEKGGLRPQIWRLLLGVLDFSSETRTGPVPPSSAGSQQPLQGWEHRLRQQRALYQSWAKDVEQPLRFSNRGSQRQQGQEQQQQQQGGGEGERGSGRKRPLANHLDDQLIEEITKDVMRTMPMARLFARSTPSGATEDQQGRGVRRREEDEEGAKEGPWKAGGKAHQALARILFIYAKLNPGVRYVQGMNEIVAILFSVFAEDEDAEWREFAEADAFFAFTTLLAELRDVYVQSMDHTDTGLHGKLQDLSSLLHKHDPQLSAHLQHLGVVPSFYALRWLSCLLSREFSVQDTVVLWDQLLADTQPVQLLLYLCVSMLLAQREHLLAGDFAVDLQLLQSYPPISIPLLLERCHALRYYDYRPLPPTEQAGPDLPFLQWDAEGESLSSIADRQLRRLNTGVKKMWNEGVVLYTEG